MSIEPIEITPYAKSGIVKNPTIFNLNYTNQDFYSMKTRLVNFIAERFGPSGTVLPNTFNDLVESSVAIMLIENWAFLADTLSFKMDQIVNELFIDTVTEVENAFRLSRLVGFRPQPPIAARSMWMATINNTLSSTLRIKTPYSIPVVSDDRPITIELFQADSSNNPIYDEDILIPAGSTVNKTIIGLEGLTTTDEYRGTGEISQSVRLTGVPVIYDSIRVEVDGVMWTQVDYFTDSQPRREYRIEFDSEYRGFVIFGNNRAGLIPSQGSRIRVTYRVGGGTAGNIVTGFIETQTQVVAPGISYSVPVTLRNYTRGEFGYDGDKVEDIRRKMPRWLRTQDRAVSGEDYKSIADQFATPYHGQIGKSTAVLRNHGCSGNIVDIYILARSGTDKLEEAGSDLKIDLTEEINKKKMLTDFVCIKDGSVITTDVSIDITLDKFHRKFELEYRENVSRKINDFFAMSRWEFGQTLKDTDIAKELSDMKEITEIDITFMTNNPNNSGKTVVAKFYEIIRPDDVNISFVYN